MAAGRFAPSPTGPLHIGNLRTALLAWLSARAAGSRFHVRMEDLDEIATRPELVSGQLRDLEAIGLDWDGEVVFQSRRRALYEAALERLVEAQLVYPCYCTRREIQAATLAPQGADAAGRYPGTCRDLPAGGPRGEARRPPALRFRGADAPVVFTDRLHGRVDGVVDDVVLRRNDGAPAYNLAVVVDDAAMGVEEVVRAEDLLSVTATQIQLARALGIAVPSYFHVPLLLGPDRARLAKRHGSVTLAERAALGQNPAAVRSELAASVGLCARDERPGPAELIVRFRALEPSSLLAAGRVPLEADGVR